MYVCELSCSSLYMYRHASAEVLKDQLNNYCFQLNNYYLSIIHNVIEIIKVLLVYQKIEILKLNFVKVMYMHIHVFLLDKNNVDCNRFESNSLVVSIR